MTEGDLRSQKLKELEKWKKLGFNYPNRFKPNFNSHALQELPIDQMTEQNQVSVAGRIILKRHFGKSIFFHLLDEFGKLQVYSNVQTLGEKYELFSDLDIGDLVGCVGFPFVTKTGEKSVYVKDFELLNKNIYPLPEKWHGLQDPESRARHRYLDLISNFETRGVYRKRAEVIKFIRHYLDSHGFLEVETPILTTIKAGANARPFVTHHNALSCDLFLRIALEIPLKKLVVGGLERVYEIGKTFRNEGIDRKHNPEFTMLEFYWAYRTFEDLMDFTEDMITNLAQTVFGKTEFEFEGRRFNLVKPFRRLSMEEAIYSVATIDRELNLRDLDNLHHLANKNGIELTNADDWGSCLLEIFEFLVEDKLVEPTFITHHPFSVSPLARRNDNDHLVTDRFELYICGLEIANAFSELNDPIDQLERFKAQALLKSKEGEEAQEIDWDFIQALEVGLPPTAGEGIGIDRLVMLLTGKNSIRDVVLFPQLRPEDVMK
ncbi:MAG: lysine--tRNA ligase [Deltaproteobacteria bacterium]|nr:lysine--tRNA ligase [Deltaproteobacteria bacterium]